jgi:hypothetical protein
VHYALPECCPRESHLSSLLFGGLGMDGQRAFALKAFSALLMGVLLGILMGVPQEELLGLSVPLVSALQSLVSTVTFVGLTTDWPIELGRL